MGCIRSNRSGYMLMLGSICLLLLVACAVGERQNYPNEEDGVIKDEGQMVVNDDNLVKQEREEGDTAEELEVGEDAAKDEVVTEGRVNLGFVHAFVASFSVIIVSELGDKTFFIAAIMAMRHMRLTVFGGAIAALALMTVLSALLGFATTVIPKVYTYYASTALFIIFGLRMLKEGWSMSPDEGQEELEEVQADLKRRDEEMEKEAKLTLTHDPESGIIRGGRVRNRFFGLLSPIFLQAFTLTFLAEWGDRSQIATIVLAAREDVSGVTIGGIIGHSICTAIAVIGGRMVAQRISARTVTLMGGVVFLLFGISAFFFNADS
ncbi:putative divalent cation/proton antiporter TMEM165 isoform X2 [Apostichopus japonicus]